MSRRSSSRTRTKKSINLPPSVEDGLLSFCTGNESSVASMLSLSKDSKAEALVQAKALATAGMMGYARRLVTESFERCFVRTPPSHLDAKTEEEKAKALEELDAALVVEHDQYGNPIVPTEQPSAPVRSASEMGMRVLQGSQYAADNASVHEVCEALHCTPSSSLPPHPVQVLLVSLVQLVQLLLDLCVGQLTLTPLERREVSGGVSHGPIRAMDRSELVLSLAGVSPRYSAERLRRNSTPTLQMR